MTPLPPSLPFQLNLSLTPPPWAFTTAAADWTPGRVLHYGCAGLKQSDHRPVVALLEVDVRQVDPQRRHDTFERLVQQAGPPDASVILTVRVL